MLYFISKLVEIDLLRLLSLETLSFEKREALKKRKKENRRPLSKLRNAEDEKPVVVI